MPAVRRRRRTTALVSGALLSLAVLATPTIASASASAPATALRDVLLVGNSQSGTVSFLDGHTFANRN
ncbi:MAG TPA: hypothetical protein VFQ42_05320 [Mycobacterium sp.]|nr:hypothetical protein [Mycobacterium sp.]